MAGRVLKVLPLFLDLKGHDAISPSLFDRDAYQARLRHSTNEVSAIRFDVLWKGVDLKGAKLKLRAELRGVGEHGAAAPDRPGNGSHARIFPQMDFSDAWRR